MKISRRSFLAASALLPAQSALAAQAVETGWPSALLMATGRPGGVYDIYGAAWGKIAQASSGVAVAYRATGGSAADILLIEQGAAQLGMTTVTVANQARTGTGHWTAGVKFSNFRALFPIFPSILQIVTLASSGITSLAGLGNRVIGVGPDGGSGSAAVPDILASIGVIPSDMPTADYGAQLRDMLAGRIDACAFIGAPPLPAITAVAETKQLGVIGFTPAEAKQVARATPGMTAMTLPPGTFPRQSMAIASVGTANFAIGAANLPDALVRAITLATMHNQANLEKVVPAAGLFTQSAGVLPGDMTFHPGAASALRSLGIEIPAALVVR
ncbi:MAG TPA: TAXI family TRAP transporter solute-binding subunit [Acidocella sp.]|nr:TAXI family TRAP transporter solute-binding subunit [Acidocella sp.]HQU03792.1 TAXI family TRAP transporter solute-binding subunit [Acidocella sp.]